MANSYQLRVPLSSGFTTADQSTCICWQWAVGTIGIVLITGLLYIHIGILEHSFIAFPMIGVIETALLSVQARRS